MPKQLTEFEKGKIIAFHENNIPKKEIAKRFNRSPNCIRKILNKYKTNGPIARKMEENKKQQKTTIDKL